MVELQLQQKSELELLEEASNVFSIARMTFDSHSNVQLENCENFIVDIWNIYSRAFPTHSNFIRVHRTVIRNMMIFSELKLIANNSRKNCFYDFVACREKKVQFDCIGDRRTFFTSIRDVNFIWFSSHSFAFFTGPIEGCKQTHSMKILWWKINFNSLIVHENSEAGEEKWRGTIKILKKKSPPSFEV